jgi:membrane-associated phospholipid phosphatase
VVRRLLLLGCFVCVCLTVATYIVAFKTTDGRTFDAHTLGAPGGPHSIPAVRGAAAALIDTIDFGSLLLLGGAAVASAALRNRRDLALAIVVLFAAATATTEALKPLLRSWDVFGGDAVREAHGFFPSGHATIVMSSAFAFVLAAPGSWKLLAAFVGGAYSAAVGVSLIVQGSHYASDVFGGFLLTGAWCGLVAAAVQGRPSSAAPARSRATITTVAGLVVAYAVVVAVAIATHSAAIRHVELHPRFAAAALGITALALALTFALAILVQAEAPD